MPRSFGYIYSVNLNSNNRSRDPDPTERPASECFWKFRARFQQGSRMGSDVDDKRCCCQDAVRVASAPMDVRRTVCGRDDGRPFFSDRSWRARSSSPFPPGGVSWRSGRQGWRGLAWKVVWDGAIRRDLPVSLPLQPSQVVSLVES